MSIGDAFPYSVPSVGSASWGGPLNNILTELINRTSTPVPLTSLSGGNFDLNNTYIDDIKYVKFQDQTPTSPAASPIGRIEYYNNNFYMVTASGAIQVTSGAGLNFTAVGGIGGDYGGANPASVRFVDASTRYDFYDDYAGAIWAYIRGRGVDIAAGATSAQYARIAYGGAGTLTFTLPPTIPGSADSMLQIDSTGAITHNTASNPVTNHIYLDTAVYVKHSDRIAHFSPIALRKTTGVALSSGTWETQNVDLLQGTAFGVVYIPLPGIHRHWRLKSLKVFMNKTTGVDNATVELMRSVNGAFSVLATATITASGETSGTATAGAPYTPVTNDVFFARITTTVNNDSVRGLELTYDVV